MLNQRALFSPLNNLLPLQDKCTLEGVSDGDLPPGVRPVGFKPLGTCFNSSDCSAGYDCKKTDNKAICSCDPSTGSDTCNALGSCVMQPCKACEVCVQAMQLFPDIAKDTTKASEVADKFRSFCAGTGRSPLACEAAATDIAGSVNGNLGRRVGALCRSLAECTDQASNCSVASVSGQPAQLLDLCSVEGVKGGKPVPDASFHDPLNSCTGDGDCAAQPGMFCSRATTQMVCSCTAGAVACVQKGSCQPTPCKVCRDCISSMQSYVASTTWDNSSLVAAAFQTACSGRSDTSNAQCMSVSSYIQSSNKGNLGRRAGALCSMLGECWCGVCIIEDASWAAADSAST